MDWFFEIPIVSRLWTCGIVGSAVLEQCGVVTKMDLMYNYKKVIFNNEYWRLLSTFFYFGPLQLDLLFYVFFVTRYSRELEETYRGRTKDYVWILFITAVPLLILSPYLNPNGIHFLGPHLSNCLIYLWSRRNPTVQLSFLGLFTFTAPYLPWVLGLFSVLVNGSDYKVQLLSILIGHCVFFFEDVYPRLNHGKRFLLPPWEWFQPVQQQHEHNE